MTVEGTELELSVSEVVDFMRIEGTFEPALREVVRRKLTAETAKSQGISVSGEELQKAADIYRAVKGLNSAEDTQNWLKSRGITVDALEEYLECNLLINKFKDELEDKADKNGYLTNERIQELIRQLAYSEWLAEAVK